MTSGRVQVYVAVLLVLAGCSVSRPAAIRPVGVTPSRFAVLDALRGRELVTDCLAKVPPAVEDIWQPSADQIAQLERDLGDLWRKNNNGCCRSNVDDYFRQYIGVTRAGRRFVYVNGFAESSTGGLDWRATAIVHCDGSSGTWGALYDLESGDLRMLAFDPLPYGM